MRTRTKKQILILGIILSALLFVILILDVNKPEEEEVMNLPEGDLTESLFDSQNPDYIKNDAFPVTVDLKHMPYTYDTVDEDGAVVDTGIIYPSGNYYLYFAETPKNVRTAMEVTEQFSKALKIDASSENAGYYNLKQESGYINGHAAEYEVDYISVQDGKGLSGAYIICYRLVIDEEPGQYDLLVGCATLNGSNEDLNNCKEIAKALVYTAKYDEKLDQAMTTEREREKKEEEKNAAAIAQQSMPQDRLSESGGELQGSVSQSSDAVSPSGWQEEVTDIVSAGSVSTDENPEMVEPSGDAKTLGVLLKQPYSDLTVRIHWTNPEVKPSMIMSDVQGKQSFDPTAMSDGACDFHLGEAKDGVYMVVIKDYAGAGTFSSELIGQ